MQKNEIHGKWIRITGIFIAAAIVAVTQFAPPIKGKALSAGAADTSISNTASFSTDVIYQIVTDRFLDGNSANNPTGDIYDKTDPRKYHGGDWAGITQEINNNYFTNLGVTALWISPPVENIEVMDPSNNTASYAGYWAKDYFRTNPYFGTDADFQSMIGAAHAKNIKVVIDFAPNHTSTADDGSLTFPEDGGLYQNGTLLGRWHNDTAGLFNHENWTDFSTYENCVYHSLYGLADLNQQNSTVDGYLKSAINHWLDDGVDGIRIDAVKHMAIGWEKNWLSSIYTHKAVFTFGEYFNGGTSSDPLMNQFANASGMNLLDYRYANAVRGVFSGGDSMTDLNSVVNATASDYFHVNDQVTFIDNHDVSRIDTLTNGNHDEDDEAYVLLLTSRGIPTIYYGSEQHAQGASDPDNRGDMPSFSQTTDAYKIISKLAPLHKSNPALAYGTSTQRWMNSDVYIYERQFGSNVVLTAVNRSQSTGYTIGGLYTALPAGSYSDVLGGLLGGGSLSVASGGSVSSFYLGAGQSAVWQYTSGAYSAPTIGNVGPMMDAPGNTITIDGRDFGTTAGTVYVGSTAASVVSWNDSEIKILVPSVAAGRYDLKVVSSGGTASGVYSNFEVLSGPQISERFMVNNATTAYGQNVYLVGSVYELGNWDASKAVGPLFNSTATIGSYPTWFYDVNVPTGTTISYKFIKKDAAGNVTWESGSNHTVTTPSSGTATATVSWQN